MEDVQDRETLETVKENRMATLETVALDQERWESTADRLVYSLENARTLITGLSIAVRLGQHHRVGEYFP